MTRDQADMLIVWLADGLALIRTWIDAQVAPQSALQPIPGVLPKEPSPEPKRKRGRPRKQPLANSILEDTANHAQASQTFHCSYCGRVLPIAVRELHEANCRSAAVGYATHVAQPGKGGSELG